MPLDKITELAKRCGAEKAQADVNNLYEIYVSGPKSQPPPVTPAHQPNATPQAPPDSPRKYSPQTSFLLARAYPRLPAPKRKREEPSPMPSLKMRKPNPPAGKTPPNLDSSPSKPPIPVSTPIPAPPPAPLVAQPPQPQPTAPPNDSITTMEQYQEKLENIKLKLSSMPRDKLQQNLAHFRTALHGLDASIATGKVPADRVTQHRLDRQILADVLKWSVEFLESNSSSVPAPSASNLSQVHSIFSLPSAQN
jgi:hypothetical protein